jgi:hypothetical protein
MISGSQKEISESLGDFMDRVIQELHAAYLEGTEPFVSKSYRWNGHYWGRAWRRGDIVRLKNKRKILITSSHPTLRYVSFNLKSKFIYFLQEAKTLFRRIMFPPKPTQTYGLKNTISTGYNGIALYVETLPPPNAPVAQRIERFSPKE